MSVRSRFLISLLCFLALAGNVYAGDADSASADYRPEIHGVIRGRWDWATTDGVSRFQVRNARVSVRGNAAPTVTYLVNADLCDRGKFLFLDAYGRIALPAGFAVQAGQFRMPFGTDSFRGPGTYIFANRSFIGKKINNYRAVGVKVDYDLTAIPLTLQAGVFNPTTIDDHTRWVSYYAYAGRAIFQPGDFTIGIGAQSIEPDSVRINFVGASAGWQSGRWVAETEYIYRHYTNDAHKATNAWNVFVSYALPLRKSIFRTWSFQARYDGMTDLANGAPDRYGRLATTESGRQRITIGSTLDYQYKCFRAAVRLNFEKYFHQHGVSATTDNNDRLTAELVIKF